MPAEIQVPGFEFQSWYFDSDSDAQIEQTGNIEIYRIEREREREREMIPRYGISCQHS